MNTKHVNIPRLIKGPNNGDRGFKKKGYEYLTLSWTNKKTKAKMNDLSISIIDYI